MTSVLLGVTLGLLIGAACRWFDLPLPAPPRLSGALLVVMMTVGFLASDAVLSGQAAAGKRSGHGHNRFLDAAPGAVGVDVRSQNR